LSAELTKTHPFRLSDFAHWNVYFIVYLFFTGITISHTINHHDIPPRAPIETPYSMGAMGDGLGCSHPHYGDGFVPHKGQGGQAAVVKSYVFTLSDKTISDRIIILHLNKFRHFCPVKQREDASFLRQSFRRT